MRSLNVRLIRLLMPAIVAMAGVLLGAAAPMVHAQQDGQGRFGRAQPGPQGDGGERRGPPGRRGGEQRQDGAAETGPRGPGPAYQRTGQMSPDERRALRREIHDVGRDVYRPGPQR